MRHRRRRAAFVVLALAATLYLLSPWLLPQVGGWLVVADPQGPADAIVVLGGSYPDRILEAVDLYLETPAQRFFLTMGPPLPGGDELRRRGVPVREEHEENRATAVQLGVPEASIRTLSPPVASTLAEAHVVAAALRQEGWDSVVIVTSKLHSRRARLTFRAVCGDAVAIQVRPSRHDPFDANDWWQRRGFARRVVIEYGKLMYYLLVDQWRD